MNTSSSFDWEERGLQNRAIVVAGGSGGLGSRTVALLVRDGARVVVGYRSNRERAQGLRDAVFEELGAEIELVEGDISEASTRRRLLETAGDLLYGLVCFSGDPARLDFKTAQTGDLQPSLDRNYLGPLLLARDAATRMKANDVSGAVVLISTMQAVSLFEGSYNYAGPKVALTHAARIMAREWGGPRSIRVNVVAPGVNRAGMALASIESGKYDRFIEDGVIPRFGRPQDVARVVRLLLEPDNYVTGQVITVDGGLTLRR